MAWLRSTWQKRRFLAYCSLLSLQSMAYGQNNLQELARVIPHGQFRPLHQGNLNIVENLHKRQAYQLFWGERPVCDAYISYGLVRDAEPHWFGNLPLVDQNQNFAVRSELFKTQIQSEKQMLAIIAKQTDFQNKTLRFVKKQSCVAFVKGQATLAADVILRADGLGYRVRVMQNQVTKVEKLFFDMAEPATVRAYVKNPDHGEEADFSVTLNAGAHLDSEFFTTKVPSGRERASSENGDFIYTAEDPEFEEANAFVHATTMHDFYKQYGYVWSSSKPMVLEVGSMISGTSNNAVYEPGDLFEDGLPRIRLGTGDGTSLQNLGFDIDVVSHEFGHHVVFNYLKSTSGQSLILHEGLADFFAFARTGDSCLGESICPSGSGACWLENQCLRHAITDSSEMNYGDVVYNQVGLAHLRSQVISGLLWQLRERMTPTSSTKLVLTAVSYLLPNSGFRDFFLALFLADHDLASGSNACLIHELIASRGFESLVQDIDCEAVQSSVNSIPNLAGSGSEAPAAAAPQSRRNKKQFWQCGVIAPVISNGNEKNPEKTNVTYLLIILGLPGIMIFSLRKPE